MQAYTGEQRKALAAEIVEQLVDCGSADDVAVERYNAWVFKRLNTIAPPVAAPAVPDEALIDKVCLTAAGIFGQDDPGEAQEIINRIRAMLAAAPEVE